MVIPHCIKTSALNKISFHRKAIKIFTFNYSTLRSQLLVLFPKKKKKIGAKELSLQTIANYKRRLNI